MNAMRNTSGLTSGWMPALIFNALLLLIPVLAINVMSATFAGEPQSDEPTAESIAETRKAIESAFEELSVTGEDSRTFWAGLVSRELEARNVSAARGFLLAAPQLLGREDARAIRAAAKVDPSGSEDQRLLRAALLFLPNDVRVGYEASARPRGTDLITPLDALELEAGSGPVDGAAGAAFPGTLTAASFDPVRDMTRSPEFSVLGTVEDLADRSRAWVRGDRQDAAEFKLAGIAMAVDASLLGTTDTRVTKAASVIKMALRSGQLDPQYARLLSQRIDSAIPDDVLSAKLETALADVAPLRVRAERVQAAFATSTDPRVAARLGPELNQIGRIVEVTSARGALTLMSHARSASDVRKARLIADAGGDRAVALASMLGDRVFFLTGMTVQWSITTILLVMALAAAVMALFLVTLSSLVRMTGRREDRLALTYG